MTTEYILPIIATVCLILGIWSLIRLHHRNHTTSQLPPYTPPAPEPQPEDKDIHIVKEAVSFKIQHYRNGKGKDVWTIAKRLHYPCYFLDINAEGYDNYDLPDYGGFEFQIIDDDDNTVAFPNKADAESLLATIIEKEKETTWDLVDD